MRQAHLLELSGLSVGLMYIGLGVLLAAVGGVGLALIMWLMLSKPF